MNKKDIQKNCNNIIKLDKIKRLIIIIYQAKEHLEFRNKKSRFLKLEWILCRNKLRIKI